MAKSSSSKGIGFFGLLTILFIGLKLANVIDWSWWMVFGPLWMPVTTCIFIAGLCAVIVKMCENLKA